MSIFNVQNTTLWIQGIFITISLTISAIVFGSFIAIIYIFLSREYKFFSLFIKVKTYVIKSTPMLVQIFLIYYGLGNLFQGNNGFIKIIKSPFFCAFLALSINSACYMLDIIKNAILGIPRGQYMAAKALGLTRRRILIKIIFPQVLKSILPAYSNESTILLKSTSLTSTITLLDVMGVGNKIMSETYSILDTLVFVSIIYIFLSILLSKVIIKAYSII